MRKSFLTVAVGALSWLVGCGGDVSGHKSDATQLEKTCALVCAQIKAAHCSADDATTCAETCIDQADAVPSACTAQRDAWLTCESTTKFACDTNNKAQATACDALEATLTTCESINPLLDSGGYTMDSTVTPQKDSGVGLLMDGSVDPNVYCPAESDDTDCTTCGRANCCNEITECNESNACSQFAACITTCANDDDACYEACMQGVNTVASDMFTAVSNCFDSKCAAACTGP